MELKWSMKEEAIVETEYYPDSSSIFSIILSFSVTYLEPQPDAKRHPTFFSKNGYI